MEGIISKVESDVGSGIATLHFQDGSSVLVESGFGLRQLADAFEGEESVVGKPIVYERDEYGIMTTFHRNQ